MLKVTLKYCQDEEFCRTKDEINNFMEDKWLLVLKN